jgi:hypothetical protein
VIPLHGWFHSAPEDSGQVGTPSSGTVELMRIRTGRLIRVRGPMGCERGRGWVSHGVVGSVGGVGEVVLTWGYSEDGAIGWCSCGFDRGVGGA